MELISVIDRKSATAVAQSEMRCYSGNVKLVELVWCKLCQFPLIPPVVVVIHVVIHNDFYFREFRASCDILLDVILHMTMKTFLRSIIPAVSPARHGLTQFLILQDVDEAITGIVASLVRMYDRLGLKRHTVIINQLIDRF